MRINHQATQMAKDEVNRKSDAILQTIQGMTMDEAEQYVEDNVTDLASARAFLKKVAKAIVYLSRKV